MPWDMIMKLPIQDRRTFIHKHNKDQEKAEKELNSNENGTERRYEGESINTFAKLEQSNNKRRG